jgi:hypothetical protein
VTETRRGAPAAPQARSGRDVLTDVIADVRTWGLSPVQEAAYLKRVAGYHHALMERAEQAERTPADHIVSAEHFGRWYAVSWYLLQLLGALVGPPVQRMSIHSEERA